MEPIYIVAGVRTAIGDFGGSLKDHSPADLGAIVIAEAVRRAGLAPGDLEHVVMGQVIQTTPKDAYLARVAALKAGVPERAPALTLNRLCGSGLQAIISASQMIALGEVGIAVAGGAEVMSRAPHHVTAARFGKKLGDMTMIDALTTVLSDPLDDYHMGVTAENVARDCAVTREDQDALAAESHRRAARAQAEGRFDAQIVPVPVRDGRSTRDFAIDEHVRADANEVAMAGLRPVFQKDGTVTAGNASGINDGAAAVVLASQAEVDARGLKPLGRILGWGHAGVAPTHMGLGPVEAVPIALARAGLSLDEIDVIESNEAFAAQACAVSRTLGFDPDKVNPNGSGISLGHPVGATGAILTVKALYELARGGGRSALVTMCIGGGQGIAIVLSEARTT
ncbi:beta-ketothiolase BktB [Sphingomonas rubra]|uniref:Acetyl-CoA C-acetyltransferase n=1 Tax=Sphingomonas rubra TaxID=634430 RepID=A0A1I5TMS8_9SPHN|nr:beta-ketothiolase BktB [Sphingomonas rubra]SFP84350.1 acetyl-CoA C-acetyltransferase [Sphingomonas rubra]